MAELSYSDWLAKYGREDCAGCEYNIITKARCTFPGRYCARYLRYIGRPLPKEVQKNAK